MTRSADLFAAAQEQLAENRQRARALRRGPQYLLQGLLVCAECGYSYYGMTKRWRDQQGVVREYSYYRCPGREALGHLRLTRTPTPSLVRPFFDETTEVIA